MKDIEMKKELKDNRLSNEIEHGKFLAANQAGEIWNWESPAGKERWKRRVEMLTSSITQNMIVLELGCGTGYFTKEIAKTGAHVVAIDISEDLINIAKKEVKDGNVEFIIENAYATKFANDSFDAVVGSSVLHHLDIDKAFIEMYRLLKPGGMMLFTEPNMLNPQIALQKNIPYLKRKLGDSPDETAFFRWSLYKKFRKCKFNNIKIIPFDFLHPSIPAGMIKMITAIGLFFEKLPIFREIAGSLYILCRK
jgi:ubiquinone/menaquinone biosynthesis C-methylase UbiE